MFCGGEIEERWT